MRAEAVRAEAVRAEAVRAEDTNNYKTPPFTDDEKNRAEELVEQLTTEDVTEDTYTARIWSCAQARHINKPILTHQNKTDAMRAVLKWARPTQTVPRRKKRKRPTEQPTTHSSSDVRAKLVNKFVDDLSQIKKEPENILLFLTYIIYTYSIYLNKKWRVVYVGQTERSLDTRMKEHDKVPEAKRSDFEDFLHARKRWFPDVKIRIDVEETNDECKKDDDGKRCYWADEREYFHIMNYGTYNTPTIINQKSYPHLNKARVAGYKRIRADWIKRMRTASDDVGMWGRILYTELSANC